MADAGSSGSSGDAGEGNAGTSGTSGGKGGAGSSGSSSGGASGMGGTAGIGAGGESGAGGMGGSCDTSKSPTEEACLVADEYAVFVAPDGSDDNDGTQATPLATLTKAVDIAATDGKLVLVCSATYDEHVNIEAGVRIYGGFKCTDWSAEAQKPLFKPTTAGPALKVNTFTDELLIDSVTFEVGDAIASGETALTAIVNASPKVTLRSVNLKAGKGKVGADALNAGFDFSGITLDDLKGDDGTVSAGGSGSIYECPGGTTTKRGSGGDPPDQNGGAGTPVHNVTDGKGGDSTKSCAAGGSGLDGAAGPAAANALGASTLGTAAVAGWVPNPGASASDGAPGQGGGGGAGKAAGGGGSGGAGGCGGKGGPGGGGGGGSIALLALASPITIISSTLSTADAGNGGYGAAGQQGQQLTAVGGDGFGTGCDGGLGGPGGAGGAGGGGAGGISVGIVWKGAMAPTVSADTMITLGKAGTKGTGGVAGTNDGIAGVSQKVLSLN